LRASPGNFCELPTLARIHPPTISPSLLPSMLSLLQSQPLCGVRVALLSSVVTTDVVTTEAKGAAAAGIKSRGLFQS
jgi:hypothetical protein